MPDIARIDEGGTWKLLRVLEGGVWKLKRCCCCTCDCDLAGDWSYSYFSVPDQGTVRITKRDDCNWDFEFLTGPLTGETATQTCNGSNIVQDYGGGVTFDGTVTTCDRLDFETGDFWTRL